MRLQNKTISLAAILLSIVVLIASCHSDPKIDPKKDKKDKGGSYSFQKNLKISKFGNSEIC